MVHETCRRGGYRGCIGISETQVPRAGSSQTQGVGGRAPQHQVLNQSRFIAKTKKTRANGGSLHNQACLHQPSSFDFGESRRLLVSGHLVRQLVFVIWSTWEM